MMSPTSSSPTESRSTPAAGLASAATGRWVRAAGCWMSVSTPPRETAWVMSSVCSATEAAAAYPAVLGGVALHPNEAPRLADRDELDAAFDEIARLAEHPRVRVVGETGLDRYRTGPEGAAVQEESFRRHIDLAKRLDKTLQVHDRDAHDDVLRILEEEGAPERTVLHCFSGDAEMARVCVERGYHLSFAGTVTFTNARPLRDALAVVPLDRVLVETDAPYLTPMPWRGSTNAPSLIPLTVRRMADVLGVAVPTLCEALSANSERLYGPW